MPTARAAAPSSAASTPPAPSVRPTSATRVRIVWHYQALSERRTFVVHYRLSGVAVAYDDVVDVNLKVWGSEWKQSLGRLTATETAPGKILSAWGHPVYVRGDVQLAGRSAPSSGRSNVPAGQFVELRTVIPRAAFTSTSGMRVASGHGPREDRGRRGRGRGRVREGPREDRQREAASVALRALPPRSSARCRHSSSSAASSGSTAASCSTGYDREYEQEPPTATEPALVPTLLRQGGEAGSYEFTATLFDLIRRGVFTSTQVTTKRPTWGGLRSEDVSDIEVGARQGGRVVDAVGELRRARRPGRDEGRPRASLALPRADRGRPGGDEQALHVVQGERRHRGRQPEVVHLSRRRAARPRARRVPRPRSTPRLPRPQTAGARCTRAGTTSSCSASPSQPS